MQSGSDFSGINEAKHRMDHIYDHCDPRLYCSTLEDLNYSIPDSAKLICQALIEQLREVRNRDTVHVVDLGCSYGINAALLRYDLSMEDLYARWDMDHRAEDSCREIIRSDQEFFENMHQDGKLEIIGIDSARNAVNFAEETGLVDTGLAVDLESEPVSEPVEDGLASTDLLMSTGCVGYVTEKSFERLMPAVSREPPAWIANFVLRIFPYQPIQDCLASWGYETEKLEDRTFLQRRMASPDEQEKVIRQLRDRNIDPSGQEADGNLVAEFFLSRPTEEVQQQPLHQLLQP
ncbi:MAG: class I SAM-dependent methyltransferase [Gammaproteobacteria bacterium]|nr:class I SAM-dependent methyltransferase [Gammaproteobacteria bacterium]